MPSAFPSASIAEAGEKAEGIFFFVASSAKKKAPRCVPVLLRRTARSAGLLFLGSFCALLTDCIVLEGDSRHVALLLAVCLLRTEGQNDKQNQVAHMVRSRSGSRRSRSTLKMCTLSRVIATPTAYCTRLAASATTYHPLVGDVIVEAPAFGRESTSP